MKDHDKLCPAYRATRKHLWFSEWCQCDLITKVRADEKTRVINILNTKIEKLPTIKVDGSLYVGMVWYNDVIDLIGGE